MGQLTGVLALLLSETPVLPLNVSRYTAALTQAMDNLQQNNDADLSMKIIVFTLNKKNEILFLALLRNAINDFAIAAQEFIQRSKSMDVEK